MRPSERPSLLLEEEQRRGGLANIVKERGVTCDDEPGRDHYIHHAIVNHVQKANGLG